MFHKVPSLLPTLNCMSGAQQFNVSSMTVNKPTHKVSPFLIYCKRYSMSQYRLNFQQAIIILMQCVLLQLISLCGYGQSRHFLLFMMMSDGCICIWVVDDRMPMRVYVYVSSIDSYYHIMRPYQRKQLHRQLQEEESQSYIEEQSIRLHRRQQRHPAPHHHNATYQRGNYPQPKKKNFWSILGDTKKQPVGLKGREDYDSRNQMAQPAALQHREERKWAKAGKTKQELDEEILRYKRSSDTASRKTQSSRGSRPSQNAEQIIHKEIMGNEEKDLSFTELQPQKTTKKQSIKEASRYEQEQQSSNWLQPVESKKKVQAKPVRKEEVRQERRVEVKPDRKQQQKVPSQQSKKPIVNAVKPDRKEDNQKKKEPVVTEQSETISLNKGFNNVSKDESSQSSCWLQEKILQSLLNQQLPDQSLSGSSESFISSIDHTLHPSEQSQSLSMQQELRMESVLQEIDSSMSLQQKDLLLSVVFIRNIQEVIVKEVWVGRLGISVSLALAGVDTIVKRSLVDAGKLSQYISFYQSRAMHSINEHTRQLRLCRLRVPQREDRKPQSGFIKKRREGEEKQVQAQQLARVVRVEVRCANCGKASEVPVIQSTREASLSCTNCGEQMIARIDSLGLQ